jgi:DNA-binding transcriptional LysR family regulator
MDLNGLRIFLAVAEHGSVSRAAEALNYVQSNITARLRKLEDELGNELFYRKSRGMGLTPAGENLLGCARKMLLLAEEARSVVAGTNTLNGKLNIGSMETTAAIRLPGFLAAFHERYPEIEVTLQTGTTGELRQLVLDYRLEGAFVGGAFDHPEIDQQEIFREEMVLVTRKGYTGLGDPRIRALIGFRQGCSYQQQLDDWLAELGRPPLKVMQFGSLEAILGCVKAGMGVTFMPRAVMDHERYGQYLAVHAVPEHFATIPTMFVRRRDMPPSANLQAFLALLARPEETAAAVREAS